MDLFSLVSAIVPRPIANEQLGDAEETLAALRAAGQPERVLRQHVRAACWCAVVSAWTLYLSFFQPRRWRWYLREIAPHLPPDFALSQLSASDRRDRELHKLLVAMLVVVPALAFSLDFMRVLLKHGDLYVAFGVATCKGVGLVFLSLLSGSVMSVAGAGAFCLTGSVLMLVLPVAGGLAGWRTFDGLPWPGNGEELGAVAFLVAASTATGVSISLEPPPTDRSFLRELALMGSSVVLGLAMWGLYDVSRNQPWARPLGLLVGVALVVSILPAAGRPLWQQVARAGLLLAVVCVLPRLPGILIFNEDRGGGEFLRGMPGAFFCVPFVALRRQGRALGAMGCWLGLAVEVSRLVSIPVLQKGSVYLLLLCVLCGVWRRHCGDSGGRTAG